MTIYFLCLFLKDCPVSIVQVQLGLKDEFPDIECKPKIKIHQWVLDLLADCAKAVQESQVDQSEARIYVTTNHKSMFESENGNDFFTSPVPVTLSSFSWFPAKNWF